MYVTVETEKGTLRGQQKTSEYFSHKKYLSFQGIPYAKPPLGSLRFKDPEEPEAWSGVRDALKEGNDCTQNHMLTQVQVGSEDCLYLNVYTPQLNCDGALAVMVWIHGGGFSSGSGSTELYGPDYLIEQDVVLVTINYRLGVLGFLCLDHEEVPGNAGLKDQVMALRWIQKNIAKFGGDPNRVTIFGDSAGAASVCYHIVSPLSQGLFHYAIIQSGTLLNPWALNNRAALVDKAFRLGRELGCDTTDTNTLLQFLRKVPTDNFLPAVKTLMTQNGVVGSLVSLFVPCVEVPSTSFSFLPASPKELIKEGKFAKVPTIIGTTYAEGILSYAIFGLNEDNIAKIYEGLQKHIVENIIGLPEDSEKAKHISKEFTQFYFGDTPVTIEKLDNFFQLFGDVFIDYGVDKYLRIMAEVNEGQPIYAYEFTHSLSNTFMKILLQAAKPESKTNFKGVCHGEDISVFFNHTVGDMKPSDADEEEFVAKLTKMWATFAKTGNPNYSGVEVNWEQVKKNSYCYLDIGREFKLVSKRIKEQRMNLWQQLFNESSSEQ